MHGLDGKLPVLVVREWWKAVDLDPSHRFGSIAKKIKASSRILPSDLGYPVTVSLTEARMSCPQRCEVLGCDNTSQMIFKHMS